jgi:hypothetical protein
MAPFAGCKQAPVFIVPIIILVGTDIDVIRECCCFQAKPQGLIMYTPGDEAIVPHNFIHPYSVTLSEFLENDCKAVG